MKLKTWRRPGLQREVLRQLPQRRRQRWLGRAVRSARGRLTGTTFDSLVAQGGQLFDLFSVTRLPASERTTIPSCPLPPNGEPVPANANVTALRRTTALFGLGLVDATPDSTFVALAAEQPIAIRGRASLVPNIAAGHSTVGKFGWKDQVPTLHQFSGDAYLNEMGITNPADLAAFVTASLSSSKE